MQSTAEDETVPFVRTVKAADAGVSMAFRWGQMIVILVGFGVTIGVYLTRSTAMENSIAELRQDVSEFRRTTTSLDKQTDANTRELATTNNALAQLRDQVNEVRNDNRELRGVVDNMRSMRESYVYDSARAARNKLLQQATTPP